MTYFDDLALGLLLQILNTPLTNVVWRIEDALRGRTTARPPLVNGHGLGSLPSCLAIANGHLWRNYGPLQRVLDCLDTVRLSNFAVNSML